MAYLYGDLKEYRRTRCPPRFEHSLRWRGFVNNDWQYYGVRGWQGQPSCAPGWGLVWMGDYCCEEGAQVSLDLLEKERLKKKMALRMKAFVGASGDIQCVSVHSYDKDHECDLSGLTDSKEFVVVKNRAGKKLHLSLPSLKEMIRYQVVEVPEINKWIEKLGALKVEAEKRRELELVEQESQRKKLERKFIVRRKDSAS